MQAAGEKLLEKNYDELRIWVKMINHEIEQDINHSWTLTETDPVVLI